MALTDVLRRISWLKFLYPGQTDLQYEQGFWNTKRQRHLASDHSSGISSGFEVTESAPASLIVSVAAGRAVDPSGDDNQVAAATDVDLTSFVAGAPQTVYIVVYFSLVETSPYVVPELGTSQNRYYVETPVVQAQLAAPAGDVIELARVALGAAATQIDDAANPDYPGTDEIDMRYRKYANTKGLSLQVSTGATDSPLAAVTVGETNCDFRDIATALAYVNALTTDETHQMTVFVLGKEDGKAYTPGAVMVIPPYTHLIGAGKPTLVFTGVAAELITLSEGASIRDFEISVDDSWEHVIEIGVDALADGITVRYQDNATLAKYAYSLEGDRGRINDCRLFPFDATKGCWGIGTTAASFNLVSNCYLEGAEKLITNGSSFSVWDNMIVRANDATGAYAVSSIGNYTSMNNIVVYVAAGITWGMSFGGAEGGCVSNLHVYSLTSSDTIGLHLLNSAKLSNFSVQNCRVLVAGSYNQLSNGRIYYPSATAFAAIEVEEDHNMMNNLRIDRGGVAEVGIEATHADADYCMINNCMILNTNGADCVAGMGGADWWIVVGNTYDAAASAPNANGGANWTVAPNYPLS